MGMLRFLLALFVILSHTGPLGFTFGISGAAAVQCFYIVSGFYISLVLNTKYVGLEKLWLFYSNRALRIGVIYIFFLVLNTALSAANYARTGSGTFARWVELWPRLTRLDIGCLSLSNVFIFGHDWTQFTELGSRGLQAPANLQLISPLVPTLFFIPQAWTLGVEVSFYALAPFLVRRSIPIIAMFCVASLSVRAILESRGLFLPPWNDGFFPIELGTFLAGALAYRAYARYGERIQAARCGGWALLILPMFIMFRVFYTRPERFFDPGYLLLFSGLAVAIPFLFTATKSSRLDRAIGELSYPMYLSHEIFLHAFRPIHHLQNHPIRYSLSVVVCTCVLSALTARYLDEPVNRFRARRAKQAAQTSIPEIRVAAPLASPLNEL